MNLYFDPGELACPECNTRYFVSIMQDENNVALRCDTCGYEERSEQSNMNDNKSFEDIFPDWVYEEPEEEETVNDPE